ncbi:glycosyltransferase family 2 protein [Candidatus Contendibacter odensensis]|uniref:Glycosyl transferase family 2 n=1 Tax=Candidatus Contendobacter odensis Run_B_J11 TaxID=1400861 RepID=A0A7U7GCL3_9GAMM|nr:glycosyltransferase [Candidatus Contendobacter odensis]CDH45671.1 Glycosyl transferase family 2 [Candidatus Contendobacter odensis Run_B_J11]
MLIHYLSNQPFENPVCSVCIANYNGIDFIGTCIDSVLMQDCGFNVEIIVHDDASNDDSVAYIRSHYPQVNLLASAENCGFCVSNNRMADIACGQFILLLNNDARLHPNALQALHQYACHQEKPSVLGLPQHNMENGELFDRGSLLDIFLNPYPNLDAGRRSVGVVTGGCLWIPLFLWRELGGFPEWFHTVAEDIYLCCVARLWGYPVEVLPDPGFDHWIGKNLGGGKVQDNHLRTTFRRRALSERNKTFVMVLTFPAPVFQIVFPLHLLLLLLEGGLLSLVKRDGRFVKEIYWPVFGALWRERQRLWRLRREIQRGRRLNVWRFFSVFQWMPHKLTALVKYGLPEVR